MKIIQALVLAYCASFLTACDTCDDPNGCGGLGQTCASWPASGCEEGLRCVDDVCVSCGHPNEVCCWTAVGPDECTNSVCNETLDSTPMCSDKCGFIGFPCCGGTSCPDPAGADCNQAANICEPISTPTACGSGPQHFVELIDPWGCVNSEFVFYSNSPDDCIAAALAELGPGWTAGPLDTLPMNCDERCQYWDDTPDSSTGADPVSACAFSAAALDACFASLCTNCLYTNEPANTCGDMY